MRWGKKKQQEPETTGDGESIPFTLTSDGDLVAQLIDHTVILSIEAQTVFAARYDGFRWQVDLSDPAVFWFQSEPPGTFRPHFIGSSSEESNTWMWGWNNINGFPDDVVDVAQRVFDVGTQLQNVELLTAHQPLDPAARLAAGLPGRDIPEHAFVYVAQAVAGLRVPVYYRAPSGSGYAWFLLDNDVEFSLPPATAVTTAMAITRALQTGYVTDHRLAVTAYTQRRDGVALRTNEDESAATGQMVIATGDGDVTVDFDELGRISNVATA